jgi:hypothetical protein
VSGCEYIIQEIQKNGIGNLQYFDVSDNYIGGHTIEKLINSLVDSSLQGLSIDGNFFIPDALSLSKLQLLNVKYLSLRGIHWDLQTLETIIELLKNQQIEWIDLFAQTIHKHSDPDLSAQMAEDLFSFAPQSLHTLYFSNHRVLPMNMSAIFQMNLKSFTIANSGLASNSAEQFIPIIYHLEHLDLSDNYMEFKSSDFFLSCAKSKSLRFLALNGNSFWDAIPPQFFHDLQICHSPIETLRMRDCRLSNKSSKSIILLHSSGIMKFQVIFYLRQFQ